MRVLVLGGLSMLGEGGSAKDEGTGTERMYVQMAKPDVSMQAEFLHHIFAS